MLDLKQKSTIESCSSPFDISVVTPSFNMLGYLRRCRASVADQGNVRYEHIIMDGGSTDGTVEWLRRNQTLVGESQRDNGMYDAVNKGFHKARGRIVSHMNCDEQYLPGTLEFVVSWFQQHPDVDVLFGNVLTVRPDGGLLSYRKGYRPIAQVILTSPLHVYTAAMFLRRRVVEDGQFYDDRYKDVGDAEFVLRLLRSGYQIRHVHRYLSTFAITGHNRSGHVPTVSEEIRRFFGTAPWWVRRFRPVWRSVGLGMKLINGAYTEKKPIVYSIYASGDATSRTQFVNHEASFRWSFDPSGP